MTTLRRKAQLTRVEFMRELPAAVGDCPWQEQDQAVVVSPARGQTVTIVLTDLGIERKGELDLPMLGIDFRFDGMSDDDIRAFLATWDEHKLRMGG